MAPSFEENVHLQVNQPINRHSPTPDLGSVVEFWRFITSYTRQFTSFLNHCLQCVCCSCPYTSPIPTWAITCQFTPKRFYISSGMLTDCWYETIHNLVSKEKSRFIIAYSVYVAPVFTLARCSHQQLHTKSPQNQCLCYQD